jgi:hypothetical protein
MAWSKRGGLLPRRSGGDSAGGPGSLRKLCHEAWLLMADHAGCRLQPSSCSNTAFRKLA